MKKCIALLALIAMAVSFIPFNQVQAERALPWILGADAPQAARNEAAALRQAYGDLVQICDGVDDQIEWNALYDNMTIGGTIYAEGSFNFSGSAVIDRSIPIDIEAYGATFKPSANSIALFLYSNLDQFGMFTPRSFNGGMFTDAGGYTGVTAIKVLNSTGIAFDHVYVGANFENGIYADPGDMQVESLTVSNSAFYSNTGIRFQRSGAGNSCAQADLRNLAFGIFANKTGIYVGAGIDLSRSVLSNVGFWLVGVGSQGLVLDGRIKDSQVDVFVEGDGYSAITIGANYQDGYNALISAYYGPGNYAPVVYLANKRVHIVDRSDMRVNAEAFDKVHINEAWLTTDSYTFTGLHNWLGQLCMMIYTQAQAGFVSSIKTTTAIGPSGMLVISGEKFHTKVQAVSGVGSSVCRIYFVDITAGDPPADTSRHVGWKIVNGEIYSSVANGTTERAVDTGVSIASPYAQVNLYISTDTDYSGQIKITFWVNGMRKAVYVGSNDCIPTWTSCRIYYGLVNTGAIMQSLNIFGYNYEIYN